ncbi:MAG: hypothetical protein KBH06_10015 [Spirochaetes bacterium]|nr:hypothetical protein [Spirochaetota bacterium]
MNFKKILFLSTIIYLLCSAGMFTAKENTLQTGTEVILTGTIQSGLYLSRDSDSEIEYMNKSFNLYTDEPVNVTDTSDKKKTYEKITHIEIINFYEFNISRKTGRKITVRGKLGVFNPRGGYSRQYSTPIYISIIEVID